MAALNPRSFVNARLMRIVIAGWVAACGLGTPRAGAGDWPQILGQHRDGRAEHESLADAWPAGGPKLVWERPGGRGYAGVAVVGERGVLFHRVESEEVVEGFAVKTGKSSWKYAIPTSYVSGISPD